MNDSKQAILERLARELLASGEAQDSQTALQKAEVVFEDTYSLVDGQWRKMGQIVTLEPDF